MIFSTEHEVICFCHDTTADLKAIIAIHNSLLGPALGGTRIFPYNNEAEALADVRELSRAMTFKAAAADLPFGGAKAVVIANPADPDRRKKLRAFCRFINMFEGQFQTGEDLGTSVEDVLFMREFSKFAHCSPTSLPLFLHSSALTARGVVHGIEAALQHRFGSSKLEDRRIAIQGLGKVGWNLAQMLAERGVRLTITDIDASLVRNLADQLKCDYVEPAQIYSIDCDVFSPCARGGVLNNDTIPQLKSPIVAGCANNQLADDSMDLDLAKRGILYAPDFVINAGGLMSATLEMGIEDQATMLARVDAIGVRLLKLYEQADKESSTPLRVIMRQVEAKLASVPRR